MQKVIGSHLFGAFEAVEREGAFALGQEENQLGGVPEEFLGKEDEEAEIIVTAIEDIG